MARRYSTTTRVLVALPALALAGVLAACHPPNEKPAENSQETGLPTYQEPAGGESGHGSQDHGAESGATTTVTVTETAGAEGVTGTETATGTEAVTGVEETVPAAPAQ